MEDLTLQNLIRWPSATEYLQASGKGMSTQGGGDQELRRKVAREAAAVEAQRGLITQLQAMVPRERIRDLLRQAEVADIEYGYDDACTLTLRIAKEAVTGVKPLSESP